MSDPLLLLKTQPSTILILGLEVPFRDGGEGRVRVHGHVFVERFAKLDNTAREGALFAVVIAGAPGA
jgi:hypothetical protein